MTKQTPFAVDRTQDQDGGDLHQETVAGGEFFVIDRRAFAAACNLGLNPAVAYLTIARGAGSRPISQWSVDAIERHTGMGRPRAKLSVKLLIDRSLLTLERAGTRPLYGIVPPHALPRMKLCADDHTVLKLFANAKEVRIAHRYVGIATDLACRGFLSDDGDRWFSATSLDLLSEEPQPVWLPNAIVDGAAQEVPPLALLRQMQDIRCLKLFVTLYDCTDLPNEGGVSREFLYETHILTKISERGACTIWRFAEASNRVSLGCSPLLKPFLMGVLSEDGEDIGFPGFWAALGQLEKCQLLTFIAHVFESDQPEAEMLHAYPVGEAGEPWERSVADAADTAARTLLFPKQKEWATENKQHFFPVPSHIDPAVVGIARLRYRPKTRKTAAWFAMSKARSEAWQGKYDAIIRSQDPSMMAQTAKSGNVQHKGRDKRGINGI